LIVERHEVQPLVVEKDALAQRVLPQSRQNSAETIFAASCCRTPRRSAAHHTTKASRFIVARQRTPPARSLKNSGVKFKRGVFSVPIHPDRMPPDADRYKVRG
jgi:flagella basal body P-ring formation protein FlgA